MKMFFVGIYKKIFGNDLSEDGRKFFYNIYLSLGGGIIAGAIMFIINILAGRWLGPEKYGTLSLTISISQILLIPLIFSLDISSVRALSRSKNDQEKSVLQIPFSLQALLML